MNTWCAFHILSLILTTATFDGFHDFPSFPDEGDKAQKG